MVGHDSVRVVKRDVDLINLGLTTMVAMWYTYNVG